MADETTVDLQVPFPSEREAQIAYNSLRVDPEPKRGGVTKILSLSGKTLQVKLSAKEAKTLRSSLNGFMDLLTLVTKTMDQFGPPVPT